MKNSQNYTNRYLFLYNSKGILLHAIDKIYNVSLFNKVLYSLSLLELGKDPQPVNWEIVDDVIYITDKNGTPIEHYQIGK